MYKDAWANNINLISANPIDFYSGGELMMITISSGLIQREMNLKIIFNKKSKGSGRINDDYINKSNLTIEEIKFPKMNKLQKFFFHTFPTREILSAAAINLINTWRPPSTGQLKTCDDSGSKVILLMHGIGIEAIRISNPTIMFYQFYLRLQFLRTRKLYVRGNIYIQVLNPYHQNFLLRYGIPKNKVFLIENGIDFSNYRVGRTDDFFKILFIGRMDNTQKGINLLAKISVIIRSQYPEIKIVAIGSGKHSQILEKKSSVDYLRYISDEEKIGLLEKSNLLILTSNLEPFGLVVLEGLASGLPVVTTKTSGPAHIMSMNDNFGMVDGFNEKGMVKCISHFYELWKSDKDNYFKLKVQRRNEAQNLFDKEVMIDRYVEMVRTIGDEY